MSLEAIKFKKELFNFEIGRNEKDPENQATGGKFYDNILGKRVQLPIHLKNCYCCVR
jgi:hypothetical protein